MTHLFILFQFLFVPLFSGNPFLIGGPMLMQQTLTEEQKINELINYVEKSNAMFIRNGSEYASKDAADHLRMKRKKAGSRIKTAREFVNEIASKSSMTGEAYKIRFKNGKELLVKDVLLLELKKIESRPMGWLRNNSNVTIKQTC
ncbi:MAG: DUF5329 domain-containing protein [Bacteroidetes bacterium]|nr:DUF5329 domain-containing protein [Bacteroidota bacterium]